MDRVVLVIWDSLEFRSVISPEGKEQRLKTVLFQLLPRELKSIIMLAKLNRGPLITDPTNERFLFFYFHFL